MKINNNTIVAGLIALTLVSIVPSMSSCAVKETQTKADLKVRLAELKCEDMDDE